MTIEEMKQQKLQKGYSYAQISDLSGVPLGTVQKIFSGETEHPRYATLQALEQVLKQQDTDRMLNDSAEFPMAVRMKINRIKSRGIIRQRIILPYRMICGWN